MLETKICVDCNEEKDISEFRIIQKKKKLSNGDIKIYTSRLVRCVECNKLKMKAYHLKVKSSIKSDIKVMDTMIEIYQKKGFNNITEAFKAIGKKELKELAYKQLNYDNTKTQF